MVGLGTVGAELDRAGGLPLAGWVEADEGERLGVVEALGLGETETAHLMIDGRWVGLGFILC